MKKFKLSAELLITICFLLITIFTTFYIREQEKSHQEKIKNTYSYLEQLGIVVPQKPDILSTPDEEYHTTLMSYILKITEMVKKSPVDVPVFNNRDISPGDLIDNQTIPFLILWGFIALTCCLSFFAHRITYPLNFAIWIFMVIISGSNVDRLRSMDYIITEKPFPRSQAPTPPIESWVFEAINLQPTEKKQILSESSNPGLYEIRALEFLQKTMKTPNE